jgi:hypothetical protein
MTLFTGITLNRCLTTEYSETTAHFNSNFDTDNQIYLPYHKCTATFRTHCSSDVSVLLVHWCADFSDTVGVGMIQAAWLCIISTCFCYGNTNTLYKNFLNIFVTICTEVVKRFSPKASSGHILLLSYNYLLMLMTWFVSFFCFSPHPTPL